MSGIVVLLLATLLIDQVGRGLVQAKTRSALAEVQLNVGQTQTQLAASDCEAAECVEEQLSGIAKSLSDRGATGGLYDVLVLGSEQNKRFVGPALTVDVVPRDLATRLNDTSSTLYEYVDPADEPPELIVGSVLFARIVGPYRLYHVFPLSAEERTLGLVRRTAAIAGVLLVFLLALIALLVTRQVVSPVRMAARTAERLASGLLEERMTVRGEDELARLATTFNGM
ncbi:MAG: two-component system, OmpR family, sensor histidine kinase MtrB, partial [Actinomycetota bacterium]|nr:two-component system, OmpR family, sensor histidine kinase MtrB [Actinomycetota bacterium]